MSESNNKSIEDEELITHLLGAKKKHDEDKNVETEEVQRLEKGTDYLTNPASDPFEQINFPYNTNQLSVFL